MPFESQKLQRIWKKLDPISADSCKVYPCQQDQDFSLVNAWQPAMSRHAGGVGKLARIDTAGVFRLQRLSSGNEDSAKNRKGSSGLEDQKFDACHVRELKPRISSQERAEYQSIECSECGSYMIAGGLVYKRYLSPHHPEHHQVTNDNEPGNGNYAGNQCSKPSEILAGGLISVFQRIEGKKWEQWSNSSNILSQDLLPVTSMSLSGSCLVTGHMCPVPAMNNVSNLSSSSAHQTVVGGLQQEMGDVWVWSVNIELQMLEIVAKLGQHTNPVTSVIVLATGIGPTWKQYIQLASVTAGGEISIWEGSNSDLEISGVLSAHSDKVNCLAYLPGPQAGCGPEMLASASNDKTVRLWSLSDMKKLHTLRHTREVYCVSFQGAIGSHRDGMTAVTASHDQKTRIWNVTTGICIQALHLHLHPVTTVAVHSNGELMASGCQGQSVILADTRSGLKMRTMRGHRGTITATCFIPQSDCVASASLDGSIRVWEVKSGPRAVIELGISGSNSQGCAHDKTVYSLAFSPDMRTLATGSRDFSVKLWDTTTTMCKHTLVGHRNFVFSVAIHPSGKLCASASHDCSIGLWDTDSGIQKQQISADTAVHDSGTLHTAEVSDVAFHPDGLIMASGSYDKSIIIYRIGDLESFMTDPDGHPWTPSVRLHHHLERVWTLSFCPTGQWLVSGAWDSMVYVYSTNSLDSVNRICAEEELTRSALHCFANVWAAEFQPINYHGDRGVAVLATGAADHKVRIWSNRDDELSWQIESVLEGHSNTVTGLAWSPDGVMLVSSSFDKTIRLWGQQKGADTYKFLNFGIWSAYVCPTMAVAWGSNPQEKQGGTMISVATMNSPTFLMDAGDAGQSYIPFSRAQHTLNQGPATWDTLLDMVKEAPETLTSLGSGMGLLIHRVVSECDDHYLLKRFLELSKKNNVTPLLPYGPRGKPLLASVNSYHNVSAVIDAIVEMGEAGVEIGASCLASGTGTCLMLTLIENFPDQAVRLLEYVGMNRSHEIVYHKDWNRRMLLAMDGMVVQPSSDFAVGDTRYPEGLWGAARADLAWWQRAFGLRPGFSDDDEVMIDVVAVHSSFPHACGMLPHIYVWGSDEDEEKKGEMDFSNLQRSFLHMSYNCGEPRLFDTPLGRAVLQFKWEAYGRKFAGIQLTVFIIHLFCVCSQSFALGKLQGAGGWPTQKEYENWIFASTVAGCLVILFSTVQATYEFCQIMAQGASNYLTDPWNVLDLCIIVVCGMSGGAVITKQAWTPYVAAVAAFFAWLKVFYFMRAFTATGGLVRMVMQILYDMRHLLLLLVVVIMAATTSFYVLLPGAWKHCAQISSSYVWYEGNDAAFCYLGTATNCETDLHDTWEKQVACEFYEGMDDNHKHEIEAYYRSNWHPGDDEKEYHPPGFWTVFLRVYGMMLGDFKHSWFSKVPIPLIGQLLWVIFMFLEMVLLLNLLIALMGDSYEKVQEKSKVEALRERAGLLVEMEMVIEYLLGEKFLLRHNYCPRWLHAVLPKEAMSSDGATRQREWSGVAGTIKADIEASMTQLKLQVRDDIDRLHDALTRDFQDKVRNLMQSMHDTLANANAHRQHGVLEAFSNKTRQRLKGRSDGSSFES